jgi:nucleotide-binding universal stress UspA family protein
MGDAAATNGTPIRLLLATDLSARCDRALDRAIQLAAEWNAELLALKVVESPHVLEHRLSRPKAKDDGVAIIRGRRRPGPESPDELQRDFQEELRDTGIEASLRLGQGEVADAVERTAAETCARLVITGMARSERLGRFLLGSTVERLASRLPQPLLVVRGRARGAYRRIVIATDFSASSADALRTAIRFFPEHELVLYHACRLPPGSRRQPGGSERIAAEPVAAGAAQEDYARFLAGIDLPDGTRERLSLRTEAGALASVLPRYVREQGVDLLVMGARGRDRGGLVGALLGSTGVRLLHRLPCDSLIVKEDS